MDVRKVIIDVRLDKSSSGDILADILKQCDLCLQALTNCINQSIVSGKFPDLLKLANISPVFSRLLLTKLPIYLSVSYLFCQRYTKD